MVIFKIFTAIFVTLIFLILVVPIFTGKILSINRSILINKPLPEVFEYIRILKNQDYFSVWASKDPGMKKEYIGVDGTVGFVSAWDSQMKYTLNLLLLLRDIEGMMALDLQNGLDKLKVLLEV